MCVVVYPGKEADEKQDPEYDGQLTESPARIGQHVPALKDFDE